MVPSWQEVEIWMLDEGKQEFSYPAVLAKVSGRVVGAC